MVGYVIGHDSGCVDAKGGTQGVRERNIERPAQLILTSTKKSQGKQNAYTDTNARFVELNLHPQASSSSATTRNLSQIILFILFILPSFNSLKLLQSLLLSFFLSHPRNTKSPQTFIKFHPSPSSFSFFSSFSSSSFSFLIPQYTPRLRANRIS